MSCNNVFFPIGPYQYVFSSLDTDDESVCLLDTRYLSERKPLCRSSNLGGGVWRIKWHPYTPNRILIAAMHAGCRVVNFNGGSCFENSDLSEDSLDGIACVTDCCTKSFTEHESMAYGADWLVCPHPTQNGYYEAAVRYGICS